MKVEQGEVRLGPGNQVWRVKSEVQYRVTWSVTITHNIIQLHMIMTLLHRDTIRALVTFVDFPAKSSFITVLLHFAII